MKTLLTLLVLLFAQTSLIAKDWSIDNLTLRALVRADGTIEFSETRTYRFDGRFTKADIEIRKRGFDRLYDIEVWMDGVPMTESDSKDPGTFRVRDRRTRVNIHWVYEAENETKVFEIRYKVAGAVVKGPEHSELFWSFIGTGWDRSTLSSDIRVDFELSDGETIVPIWVEGGVDELWQESVEEGRVEVVTGRVPRRDGLRIRMVFPSDWVAGMPVTDASFTMEAAIADELAKADQAVSRAEFKDTVAEVLTGLLPLLVFGPMLIFGYAFNRYGKRFTPPIRIPETGHTPPSDLPPAVVSWMLMSRQIYPQALVATLLDLARRGYLTLSTAEEPQRFGKPKLVTSVALVQSLSSAKGLQDFELELLRHIEMCAPEGPIRLPDLLPPNKSATTKWYMAWTKLAKANAEARGFMDASSTRGVALSAIVCVVFLLASFVALWALNALGLFALGMSLTFFIASFFIYRRSETGEIQYRLWKAYRNGLRSGNASDLSDAATGTHLIYAVALGVTGGKLTRMLEQLVPDESVDHWLSASGFAHNPAIFASQVSGMVTSASAGVSSASGAAAGSAGGGGGGGAS